VVGGRQRRRYNGVSPTYRALRGAEGSPRAMRLALLVIVIFAASASSARAQERREYQYFISAEVHNTLLDRIERERLGRPERAFFLIINGYGGREWGLELQEYSGVCDTTSVATSSRFITLDGERFRVVSDADNWFGVYSWYQNPFDPIGTLRPLRRSCMRHWPYIVRFNMRGEITGVENERPPKPRPWSQRDFLRAAVDLMVEDLDITRVGTTSLDYYSSIARTRDGTRVVVAVMDDPEVLADVLADVGELRTEWEEWATAPLWIYVPPSLDVNQVEAVVRRVPFPR